MPRRLPGSLKALVLGNATGPSGGARLKPDEDLARCLEKAILKGDESHTPSKAFHPSSMQCERNMFYQLKGVEQESDRSVSLIGICDSGTDRHLRLQKTIASDYMRKLGWEFVDVVSFIKERNLTHLEVVSVEEMEVKLYDKTRNVSFLTDGILRWKYDGKYYILEIKTESSRKFYKRKEVDPKHRDQGTIYPIEFGLDTGTIFLYESRDDTSHKLFYFPVTEAMKARKEEQLRYVTACAESNELPPRPSDDVREYACTYCGFKALCALNHNGDGHIDPKYLTEENKHD